MMQDLGKENEASGGVSLNKRKSGPELGVRTCLFSPKNRKKRKYFTIGVRRRAHSRVFFMDIDAKTLHLWKTRDGFHVTAILRHGFDYLIQKKKPRLRIGSKLDSKGNVVNQSPKLIYCSCKGKHRDERLLGRLELYVTNSR